MREKIVEVLITLVVLIAMVAFSLPQILPECDNIPVFLGLLVLAAMLLGGTAGINNLREKLKYDLEHDPSGRAAFRWEKYIALSSLKDSLGELGFFIAIAIVVGAFSLIHPWVRIAYAIFCSGILFACVLCMFESCAQWISRNINGGLKNRRSETIG